MSTSCAKFVNARKPLRNIGTTNGAEIVGLLGDLPEGLKDVAPGRVTMGSGTGRHAGRGEQRMRSDLVRRAQGGDGEAFETLIRAAYDRLYALAERILRDRYAAEDA